VQWLFDVIDAAEEFITDVSTSPWFYLVLFSLVTLDSVIPAVPSEFTVIAGGVAAAAGTLIDGRPVVSVMLVIIVAALAAYTGDSLAYLVGNRSERLVRAIFFRGEKGDARLKATAAQVRKRGGVFLVTARFIPAGRTAMTFSCGLTGQPFWSWFTRWDLLAAVLWAIYVAMLGYFVSGIVEDSSTALWVAFGLALSITALSELYRSRRERRRARQREASSPDSQVAAENP